MDINTSQVGRDFAVLKVDEAPKAIQASDSTEDLLTRTQQEAKGLTVSAEIEEQESVNVSDEQIQSAVSQLSDFVQTNSRQLNFSVDEDSNRQVVKVTDAGSGEVIRQIPSEEILELSERLQDLQTEVGTAVGLLFNKQV